MTDLHTEYLGLRLRSPLVASAGPYTGDLDRMTERLLGLLDEAGESIDTSKRTRTDDPYLVRVHGANALTEAGQTIQCIPLAGLTQSIVLVQPGRAFTEANPLCGFAPVNAFNNADLPAFERPTSATSGRLAGSTGSGSSCSITIPTIEGLAVKKNLASSVILGEGGYRKHGNYEQVGNKGSNGVNLHDENLSFWV